MNIISLVEESSTIMEANMDYMVSYQNVGFCRRNIVVHILDVLTSVIDFDGVTNIVFRFYEQINSI